MNSTNHKTHCLLKVLELPPPQTCVLEWYRLQRSCWLAKCYLKLEAANSELNNTGKCYLKLEAANSELNNTGYHLANSNQRHSFDIKWHSHLPINVTPLYHITLSQCTWLLLVHRLSHNTSKHPVTDSFMLAWRFTLWLPGNTITKAK